MQQAFLVSLIVLSIGLASAIRVKLEKKDVKYIATEYTIAGEPEEFDYFSAQVEMVAVDARKRLVYAIGETRLSVLKILGNKTLELLHTETLDGFPLESIQTCRGFVTVAARNDEDPDDYRVFVFRGYRPSTGNLQMFQSIFIRHSPRHHVVTRNCRRIIVALRGPGEIGIINFKDSKFRSPTVLTISFSAFAKDIERLEKEWFLFSPIPSATFEQLVIPRWLCLNKRETKAYVSLPNNNGIAVVDLRPGREHVKRLRGLGLKSWAENEGTQGFDGSNTPQKAELKNAPIFSTYNPNQLSCQTIRKKDYIFLAGEGLATNTDILSDLTLDEDEGFPPELANSQEFGDLRVLSLNSQTDTDGDEKVNKIVTPGSRSFAAFSGKKLTVLADTGSDLELKTMNTVLFNAGPSGTQTLLDAFDSRSTSRGGLEPELVITKQICRGRYIVLVGAASNPGHLFVYTLDTKRLEIGFVFQDRIDGYERKDSLFEEEELYNKGLLSLRSPKGLAFTSDHYYGGRTMVVSGSRGSSSVELFDLHIDCRAMTPEDQPPE